MVSRFQKLLPFVLFHARNRFASGWKVSPRRNPPLTKKLVSVLFTVRACDLPDLKVTASKMPRTVQRRKKHAQSYNAAVLELSFLNAFPSYLVVSGNLPPFGRLQTFSSKGASVLRFLLVVGSNIGQSPRTVCMAEPGE